MISESNKENEKGRAVRIGRVVKETTLLFPLPTGGDLTIQPGDDVVLVVTRKPTQQKTKRWSSTKPTINKKDKARLEERLLAEHPLLKRLSRKALDLAIDLARNHDLIRVYRTGNEIRLSREAMHTPHVREVFALHP